VSQVDSPLANAFPKPGRTLRVVLLGVFAAWLAFAVGLNWAGASPEAFYLFCGNTERILHGEIWRLFTAPWMHLPSGTIGHVLSALLGLYFLSPSLESQWGSARFARFLFFSALIAYASQMLLELVLPDSLSQRLVGAHWFGAIPVVDAVAIAWAVSFRGRSVHLFGVLPISSRTLILFVVGVCVMYVIIAADSPSGLIAPFGGMLAGWLLGGGTPSPMRRAWLRFRLAQLDASARSDAKNRKRRVNQSGLRVIEGGTERDPDSGDDEKPGRGGRWLN